MDSKIRLFFENLKNKKIAFLGVGVTNNDIIKLFLDLKLDVTVCDKKDRASMGKTADAFEKMGAKIKCGEDYLENLDCDIIFRAPGVNYNLVGLEKLRESGKIITSDMEVFFELCPCPIIAVTGSDGKTTTTSLIAQFLRQDNRAVHLGGNIGKALLPTVFDIKAGDYAVVELSSFQLISMNSSPLISVVTNIEPNHLDVHSSMDEYIEAKKNIVLHQNAFSKTVLNFDNHLSYSFAKHIRGREVLFSLKKPVHNGAFLQGNTIYYSDMGEVVPVMDKSDIRLPGEHNIANYLAAVCAVYGIVSFDTVKNTARTFPGVEHRIEFVREINGVKWYNDSIATSPTRAIAGLRSFNQKLIMIAGGYDKKIPFNPLAPEIINSVKLLILTGPTAEKIKSAVENDKNYNPGDIEIIMASDIPDAVKKAASLAENGDIVTLSPASASFDCYRNFEQRGNHFKELVNKL